MDLSEYYPPQPVHTYTSAGNSTISLIATNAGGSGSVIKTNYILVTSKPPTITSISPASGPQPVERGHDHRSGFTSASTVTFGTSPANVMYNTAARQTVTSPLVRYC